MSDLIERQKAIELIHSLYPSAPIMRRNRELWEEKYKPYIEAEKALEKLPSAQPNLQPTCNQLATDAISRTEAIDEIKALYEWHDTVTEDRAIDHLKRLPSAQPDRKTGWWLIREGISDAQCSECGMYFNDVYDMENSDAFCRHCGTKMEGLKVVEDE